MGRTGESYYNEAICMAQFILEGNNEQETADEFGTSRATVQRRLKTIGHTYADLVELRMSKKGAS